MPWLQTLRLDHARKFQSNFGCGFAYSQYFESVARAFADYIVNKSPFYAKCQPRFQLEAVGTTLTSTLADLAGNESGQYRFKFSSDEDWKLDGDVYDCDADSDEDVMGLFD